MNQKRKKITLNTIKKVYRLAERVHKGKLSKSAAQYELSKNAEMNPNSAAYYIQAFLCMMKGKRYARTINELATRHFLKMIHTNFGQQAFFAALSSVEQHADNYEKFNHGKLQNIIDIHREFSKKYIL